MLKINPVIPKGLKRYCLKNTVNARYERNMDLAMFSGLGLGAQVFRFPNWGTHDISITALLGATFLHGIAEALERKIDLIPIKKRAKAIKKASKS